MKNDTLINQIFSNQKEFFNSGATLSLDFRKKKLIKLRSLLLEYQSEIIQSVYADMKKSEYEAFISEIGGTILELKYALRHIKKWMKPKKIRGPLTQFKASGKIFSEPKGVVLIIGPWNYPINLLLSPLVAAISAGNCVILKPSEIAQNASKTVARIINDNFEPFYIKVIEGGVETAQELLQHRFDHIFFTGGTRVGKIIMESASKHLTPVTLELGGKSPVIIDKEISNIQSVAEYIANGKFLNCGQTCIAPDHIFVHSDIASQLIEAIKVSIQNFYGFDIKQNKDYPRIINKKHFTRLKAYLNEDVEIMFGGETDPEDLYISPTLVRVLDHQKESVIMNEEIFGPILPFIEYKDVNNVISFIRSKPKPLALYLFSKNKDLQQKVIQRISFGGGCINDTIVHPSLSQMPFGGIGDSGMGAYHGVHGFNTFSHQKSIFFRSPRFDLTKKFRFPPYKNKLNLVKRFLK